MPTPPTITVRLAVLQDTEAITALYTSRVQTWRHLTWPDQPIAVYHELGLYERWLHAGIHGSLELCAIHLHRLAGGSGTALVACFAGNEETGEGESLAEAEIYESEEAAPFGRSLHIAALGVHTRYAQSGLAEALIDYTQRMAQVSGCSQLTVTISDDGEIILPPVYAARGFKPIHTALGVHVTASGGRAVYQATLLTDPDPAQIRGWQMILGRAQASRVEWELLFPQQWAAGVPEIADRKTIQTRLTVAGQNAIVYLQEADEPGLCDLKCWAARPLSVPLLAALRDYTGREGFTAFRTLIGESSLPLLQSVGAVQTEQQAITYALPIASSGGTR